MEFDYTKSLEEATAFTTREEYLVARSNWRKWYQEVSEEGRKAKADLIQAQKELSKKFSFQASLKVIDAERYRRKVKEIACFAINIRHAQKEKAQEQWLIAWEASAIKRMSVVA